MSADDSATAAAAVPLIYEDEELPEIDIRELVDMDSAEAPFSILSPREVLLYLRGLLKDDRAAELLAGLHRELIRGPAASAAALLRERRGLSAVVANPRRENVESGREFAELSEEAGRAPTFALRSQAAERLAFPLEVGGEMEEAAAPAAYFDPPYSMTAGVAGDATFSKRTRIHAADRKFELILESLAYSLPTFSEKYSYLAERAAAAAAPVPTPTVFTSPEGIAEAFPKLSEAIAAIQPNPTDETLSLHDIETTLDRHGFALDALTTPELEEIVAHLRGIHRAAAAAAAAIAEPHAEPRSAPAATAVPDWPTTVAAIANRPLELTAYLEYYESYIQNIPSLPTFPKLPKTVEEMLAALEEKRMTLKDLAEALRVERIQADYKYIKRVMESYQEYDAEKVSEAVERLTEAWAELAKPSLEPSNIRVLKSWTNSEVIKTHIYEGNPLAETEEVYEEQAAAGGAAGGAGGGLGTVIGAGTGAGADAEIYDELLAENAADQDTAAIRTRLPPGAQGLIPLLQEIERRLGDRAARFPWDKWTAVLDLHGGSHTPFILAMAVWSLETAREVRAYWRGDSPGAPFSSGVGVVAFLTREAAEAIVYEDPTKSRTEILEYRGEGAGAAALQQATLGLLESPIFAAEVDEIRSGWTAISQKTKEIEQSLAEAIAAKKKQKVLYEYVRNLIYLPGLLDPRGAAAAAKTRRDSYCLQKLGADFVANTDWRDKLKRLRVLKDTFAKQRISQQPPPALGYYAAAGPAAATEGPHPASAAAAATVAPAAPQEFGAWLAGAAAAAIPPRILEILRRDSRTIGATVERYIQLAERTSRRKNTGLSAWLLDLSQRTLEDYQACLTAIRRIQWGSGLQTQALDAIVLPKVGYYDSRDLPDFKRTLAYLVARGVCGGADPEAVANPAKGMLALAEAADVAALPKTIKDLLDGVAKLIELRTPLTETGIQDFVNSKREEQKTRELDNLSPLTVEDRELLLQSRKLGLAKKEKFVGEAYADADAARRLARSEALGEPEDDEAEADIPYNARAAGENPDDLDEDAL